MTANSLDNLVLTFVPSEPPLTDDAPVGTVAGQVVATWTSATVLTLDEVKKNLRVYHSDDDDVITGFIESAEDYLTRIGVVISSPIVPTSRMAALLLIGHWYNNREATVDAGKIKLPLGLDMLLNSLRTPSI